MYFDLTSYYNIDKDGYIKVYLKDVIERYNSKNNTSESNNDIVEIVVTNDESDAKSKYIICAGVLNTAMTTINVAKHDKVSISCFNSNGYMIPENESIFIILFEESSYIEDIDTVLIESELHHDKNNYITTENVPDITKFFIAGYLYIDDVYYYITGDTSIIFNYNNRSEYKYYTKGVNSFSFNVTNNLDVDNIYFIASDKSFAKHLKLVG